jgi:serine/threonine protein kinase
MAPEISGKIKVPKISEKADIFSLGCILNHLITGKEAFTGLEKDEGALQKKISLSRKKVERSHPKLSILF